MAPLSGRKLKPVIGMPGFRTIDLGWCFPGFKRNASAVSGVRLGFLAAPAADDTGDVGLAFLFFLEECVLVVARRNLRRIFAEIDDLLFFLERRLGTRLLNLFEADDLGGFRRD